jgi:hypothetical protein
MVITIVDNRYAVTMNGLEMNTRSCLIQFSRVRSVRTNQRYTAQSPVPLYAQPLSASFVKQLLCEATLALLSTTDVSYIPKVLPEV